LSQSLVVSVVIPTRNSPDSLRSCLAAIQRSKLQPTQCIVVDDWSSEPVSHIVEEFGYTHIRTPSHVGPAAARNLGASRVDSDILFFTDDDVEIQADTLTKVRTAFEADPALTALIGSYDGDPGHSDFLSQYRNLQHHFVHQVSRREASTFWSGCGAIRRNEFSKIGGFCEGYRRPSVEDIELGYRLHAQGLRIRLDKGLQVKHLKHWTLARLLVTDVRDRGFLWARLSLDRRFMPVDLNLTILSRFSVLLAALTAAGTAWSAAAVSVEALAFPLWLIALSLLGVALWGVLRPIRSSRIRQGLDWALGAILIVVTFLILFRISSHPGTQLATVSYGLLITLNAKFYLFLTRKKGLLFAYAATSVQLLFHLGNAFSFTAAFATYVLTRGRVLARNAHTAWHRQNS
jgi:GT2 family glycosyltransferase